MRSQSQSSIQFQVLEYKFPFTTFKDIGSFEPDNGHFKWHVTQQEYFKNGETDVLHLHNYSLKKTLLLFEIFTITGGSLEAISKVP